MGRYVSRDVLHAGVDYVKALIEVPDECILNALSANSNQFFFEYDWKRLTVTKLDKTDNFPKYFSITFEGVSVAFIGYGNTETNPFFEFTGQWIALFWIGLFYHVFEVSGIVWKKYKRIDLCFDMALEINYFKAKILLDEYKDAKQNFSEFTSKTNGVETMYFGKKKIKQNDYLLNRIYNKILDSKVKSKLFLYDDYKKTDEIWYKNVTRFETELRERLVSYYPFWFLNDEKAIFLRLVKSFYKYNPQFFKFLKQSDFFDIAKKEREAMKKNLKKIRDGETKTPLNLHQDRILKILSEKENAEKYGQNFVSEAEKKQTLSMFVAMAKKMHKNGYEMGDFIAILRGFVPENGGKN